MAGYYTVTLDEQQGIVIIRFSGMAVHGDHLAARQEAFRLCRENNVTRLLVDLRDLDASLSSTMDCLDFGASLAREAHRLRLAHVMPREPKSREEVTFTTAVESNRGVTTREFDDIEKARKWLMEA